MSYRCIGGVGMSICVNLSVRLDAVVLLSIYVYRYILFQFNKFRYELYSVIIPMYFIIFISKYLIH